MAQKTVWIGMIPEIFGYGIAVIETNEKKCYQALKKALKEWNGELIFKKTMEYYGGEVKEIEFGRSYFDDFKDLPLNK